MTRLARGKTKQTVVSYLVKIMSQQHTHTAAAVVKRALSYSHRAVERKYSHRVHILRNIESKSSSIESGWNLTQARLDLLDSTSLVNILCTNYIFFSIDYSTAIFFRKNIAI